MRISRCSLAAAIEVYLGVESIDLGDAVLRLVVVVISVCNLETLNVLFWHGAAPSREVAADTWHVQVDRQARGAAPGSLAPSTAMR